MLNHLKLKHPSANLENNTDCACGKKQASIMTFTALSWRCDQSRAERTVLIAKMIAKDMLPISFVEGNGFKELMEYIEPEYTVPARKTIVARLEKLHTECPAAVSDKLAIAEKVAITTDSWTALNTESYVTITCHFIRQWEMESVILQTRAMPERHTAENLADMLNTVAETWNLKGKITACVHDNASNIVLENTALLEWESNPCFAHTLQLAINDGFKVSSINRVVGAASRLISHFHHSTVATQALKLKQQQQNLPQHRLMQYCKMRWNLISDMFERLQEQRWAIAAVLSDRSFTKLAEAQTLELTDDNWQIIEEFLPVLRSLKCATTALCGESEVSVSMVYPVTATLLSKHLKPVPEESNKVTEFKTAVSESLRRRLEPVALHRAGKAVLISSLLDPRHKHLKFIDVPVRMAVREKLDELLSNLPQNNDNIAGVGPHTSMLEVEAANSTVKKTNKQTKKKLHTECDKHIAMATLFGDDYYMEKASVQTELENYILEPCIPPNQDPLEWWRVSENHYRKLARLAKVYLCILATSVPAERVFSAAGLIVNRLRSRLSPEHVDMLIFLSKNL
ncbi:E3 SUMO-protein ligase ZBED1-like [Latimeria chalumnae]|uniref:E3 SUMO-protein ligase ZBED1-like n=1 Tax=Latimeria chalumnae TaxID=7897 RepID=UPI00313AE6AE